MDVRTAISLGREHSKARARTCCEIKRNARVCLDVRAVDSGAHAAGAIVPRFT
jgi:hypothetical protein